MYTDPRTFYIQTHDDHTKKKESGCDRVMKGMYLHNQSMSIRNKRKKGGKNMIKLD
jgi:hypothetical protein